MLYLLCLDVMIGLVKESSSSHVGKGQVKRVLLVPPIKLPYIGIYTIGNSKKLMNVDCHVMVGLVNF